MITYKESGVDIDKTDELKRSLKNVIVQNEHSESDFASLFYLTKKDENVPLIVFKTEEPGTKTKLAFQYNENGGDIAYDMINHLINDVIVTGATPRAVQDCIITGKMNSEVLENLIKDMSNACEENHCELVGGETSIQPGIVKDDTYILSSSCVGYVYKNDIIDGHLISQDNIILGIASNGLHTNGYSLIRKLLDSDPDLANTKIPNGDTFINEVLKPHMSYYDAIRGINGHVLGMAHITGGGIHDNLIRILPENIDAIVYKNLIDNLPIFEYLQSSYNISDEEMYRTFNMGIGLVLIVQKHNVYDTINHINSNGYNCYEIGSTESGSGKVKLL